MVTLYKEHLSPALQAQLVGALREVARAAPFVTPAMPQTGAPMQFRLTNCGPLGWVADRAGYRYVPAQPDGRPWPAMPALVAELAREVGGPGFEPQACLVNLYRGTALLGWHRDDTEERFDRPVVSVSLGDTGRFAVAGNRRPGPTDLPLWERDLRSGDVLVMSAESRLRFHAFRGITGHSDLLRGGGRIALTIRQVR